MTATPQGSEPWMPNGFPPPSFVVETERVRTFAGARGRWLAAAALLGAVLLIAGIVLIARQGEDQVDATGTTTTAFGGTNPTFPGSTAPLDPTATLPNAGTNPGGAVDPNATAPGATTTTTGGGGAPAAPGVSPGVLAVSAPVVDVPTVDIPSGSQRARLTLSNTGGTGLTYGSDSTLKSVISVSPPSGPIPAGGSVAVEIIVSGATASERHNNLGPVEIGQVGFSANGAVRVVGVRTILRRPPDINPAGDDPATCTAQVVPSDGCSNQVARSRSGTSLLSACNSPWRIRVFVRDDAGVEAVSVAITEPNGATTTATATKEPNIDAYFVDRTPAARGQTKFKVTAADRLKAVITAAEQTVNCPPPA